jgi:hypothetical protein
MYSRRLSLIEETYNSADRVARRIKELEGIMHELKANPDAFYSAHPEEKSLTLDVANQELNEETTRLNSIMSNLLQVDPELTSAVGASSRARASSPQAATA